MEHTISALKTRVRAGRGLIPADKGIRGGGSAGSLSMSCPVRSILLMLPSMAT